MVFWRKGKLNSEIYLCLGDKISIMQTIWWTKRCFLVDVRIELVLKPGVKISMLLLENLNLNKEHIQF